MELRLRLVERSWDIGEHLRHLEDGEWLPMQGPDGAVLPGIHGKRGVRGIKSDGSHIGLDFIRMQPGSRFALHVHEGDHELFCVEGSGFVHIDGEDIAVRVGHAIHIPAEYPHGVWTGEDMLIFAATGHPHHHVHARDRMRTVDEP